MHIKINRQKFLNAMKIVQNTVKDNKIKPILSCIHLKVKENKLYFCGTDLENIIKTDIDIEETILEGEIAIAYSTIEEYLKETKDSTITLKVKNENELLIETDNSTTEFAVFSTEDYPNVFNNLTLNENNLKFSMSSHQLIDIFEKVIFAVDSPANIALNSIKIESVLKHLHFVSTDSHRLVFLKKNIDKDIENFSISVPAESINSIISIIKPLEDDIINVYQENGHLYFTYKNILIICKLVELKYPNYLNILSRDIYDKKLIVPVDKLQSILKRIIIFSRSNNESKYSATCKFENNSVTISALNNISKINEKNELNFMGGDLKISLNIKYLLDFIQHLPKNKEVEINLKDSDSSIKIYEKDNENYMYILMPLALGNEDMN